MRQQVHDLRIKSDLLEKKLTKQEKLFLFDRERWTREKEEMERYFKEEMEKLRDEKEAMKIQSQHEIKNKITEVSLKFNQIQREMEVSDFPSRPMFLLLSFLSYSLFFLLLLSLLFSLFSSLLSSLEFDS
jgi:hypothetical protein